LWFFEICHRKIGHYYRCRRKTINKQINALQEEIGKLKSDIRLYASLNRDSIRDYHEMVLGDMD